MTELNTWWHNKGINPYTKRNIKSNGRIFNKLLKDCLISESINDSYHKFRNNKKDPLIHMNLPLIKNKPLFEYKYCWEPLTGEIISIDPRGPLYFDPDTLIYYFYTNRLKYLWTDSVDGFTGSYGDGLGNGPNFYIHGRGYSLHYYLFRLPLFDAFCDNISNQQTTVAPILSLENITLIYKLACQYKNNYKKIYGKDRPNLIEIYNLYNKAIEKPQIDEEILNILRGINGDNMSLTNEDIDTNTFLLNKIAIDALKII